MLVQHPGAGVKGNGHGIGLEPQTVLPGDLAGRGAQIVQMVVALFELVLQSHEISLLALILECQNRLLKPKKSLKSRFTSFFRQN